MERGRLLLRDFLHFAVQFGCGGLVDLCFVCPAENPDSLQDPQYTDCVYVTGIFRRFERHSYMGLGGQIVHLVRLHFCYDVHEGRSVRQIPLMESDCVFFQ